MKPVLDWLNANHEGIVRGLADLVAVPSISTDGEHQKEIEQSAAIVCEQMRGAGLNNVEVLRSEGSNPYSYGEYLGAPGKPTVFLYAHHDVQPINFVDQWKSPPWTLTPRSGRLFARGAADDKGAVAAQLGAIAAWLKTVGNLPVNVKMLVEGEEEIGSRTLVPFLKQHKKRLQSDVIVVCDTGNIETGIPSITYSLRGIVGVVVEVESAKIPVHSGTGGGALPDAALALNVLLSRLYWKNGKIPVPHFYDKVRALTPKERKVFQALPGGDEERWRKECYLLPESQFALEKGYNPYEQTWRRPSATVIAQEASSVKGASNQVLPRAAAVVSCRIVPDQEPGDVLAQLKELFMKDPPWGVKVTVKPHGPPVPWWMTDPNGPAFEAALAALRSGFKKDPVPIGCGGSIGFVGPVAELFGGAPALLLGIEDAKSNAHAPNESLHEGDFRKLMASLAHLFDNLGKLPDGRVK
jgi:acetylornithine deacetylase/succinyl-diaminopimelate desuccinylase-like protein